jgi:hypothetical protein
MPCFKDRHFGLVPDQFARLEAAKALDVARFLSQLVAEPYPRGLSREEINGVCPVMLECTLAGCVSSFVHSASLDDERMGLLERGVAELRKVVPLLPTSAQPRFRSLLRISEMVLEKARDA